MYKCTDVYKLTREMLDCLPPIKAQISVGFAVVVVAVIFFNAFLAFRFLVLF